MARIKPSESKTTHFMPFGHRLGALATVVTTGLVSPTSASANDSNGSADGGDFTELHSAIREELAHQVYGSSLPTTKCKPSSHLTGAYVRGSVEHDLVPLSGAYQYDAHSQKSTGVIERKGGELRAGHCEDTIHIPLKTLGGVELHLKTNARLNAGHASAALTDDLGTARVHYFGGVARMGLGVHLNSGPKAIQGFDTSLSLIAGDFTTRTSLNEGDTVQSSDNALGLALQLGQNGKTLPFDVTWNWTFQAEGSRIWSGSVEPEVANPAQTLHYSFKSSLSHATPIGPTTLGVELALAPQPAKGKDLRSNSLLIDQELSKAHIGPVQIPSVHFELGGTRVDPDSIRRTVGLGLTTKYGGYSLDTQVAYNKTRRHAESPEGDETHIGAQFTVTVDAEEANSLWLRAQKLANDRLWQPLRSILPGFN